jgi:hypothetical protein
MKKHSEISTDPADNSEICNPCVVRKYRPLGLTNSSVAPTFLVTFSVLQINWTHPDMGMRVPHGELQFEHFKSAFKEDLVRITGGKTKKLWWNITLKAEDAAELQNIIAEEIKKHSLKLTPSENLTKKTHWWKMLGEHVKTYLNRSNTRK